MPQRHFVMVMILHKAFAKKLDCYWYLDGMCFTPPKKVNNIYFSIFSLKILLQRQQKNINKITFFYNFSKSLSSPMQHISHFLKCHLPSFFWYEGTKKSASCLFLMPTCITVLHQCCMASVLWSISPTFYESICANILAPIFLRQKSLNLKCK